MIKKHLILIFLVVFTNSVSADLTITDNIYFSDSNITLTPMTITNSDCTNYCLRTYNSTDTPANTVELNYSGHLLRLSAPQGATITINTFDITTDSYNITAQGNGTLSLSANVSGNNKLYNFFKNGVYNFGVTSDSSGWIILPAIALDGTPTVYTWPNQHVFPQPPSNINNSQAGGAAGAGPTNSVINLSNLTAPFQPYLNINTVAEDTTGMMLFQILFMLGFFMVAFFILKDNVKTSTLITGVILMGLSYYVIGDAVTTWMSTM